MDNLIQDTMDFTYQLVEDSSGGSIVKLSGLFQKAEAVNANGRIYPTTLLNREVSKLQEMVKESRLIGEVDHPNEAKVHLDRASHKVTKLEMKGKECFGVLETIKTPAGFLLEGLIKSGLKLGISSRGTGSVKEDKDGKVIVQDDYNLITFDIVHDPSTSKAFLQMNESKQKEVRQWRQECFNRAMIYAAEEIYKIK